MTAPIAAPAKVIRAAAERLRTLARAAVDATTCGCHPGNRTTQWEYNGDASVNLLDDSGHDVITGASWGAAHLDEGLGRFIAAMDPAMAAVLVKLLDDCAESMEQEARDWIENSSERYAYDIALLFPEAIQ